VTLPSLQGKVALVTGAGRGIGRAHAGLLARLGAQVVVNDLGTGMAGDGDDSALSDRVAAELEADGGSAVGDASDSATFAGAARAVRHAVEAFGRIDILINNAGIVPTGSLTEIDEATLLRLLSVHYLGAVGTARAALPYMAAQGGGRIINTVSEVALDLRRGGGGGYGAAKAAVWSATFWMAAEGSEHGVTANAISPGAATRMNAALFAANGGPPPGLDLDPIHVARVAAWLASDEAGDVTGRVVHVAGPNIREYEIGRRGDTTLATRIGLAVGNPEGPPQSPIGPRPRG
jgi:NAD(P)-dependent dehydrogenase (short-subunit alcohol dehydrogenase family)